MVKVILAENEQAALDFCREHHLPVDEVVIVRGFRTLEGLRFRYYDVVRVTGWSKNPEIEEIEDIILRTSVAMGCERRSSDDPKLPLHTRDFLRMVENGELEGVCTYGTETH